jgi:hypothetical protein
MMNLIYKISNKDKASSWSGIGIGRAFRIADPQPNFTKS